MFSKNYLERLSSNELFNLSKFVVEENFNHHQEENNQESINNDILSVYNEEFEYKENSKTFVYKDHLGNIIGSIRIIRWNYTDQLPIQKIFNINPLMIAQDYPLNEIWHIGRFAVKKGIKDPNMFKKLMVAAITPIYSHPGNIAFAECDSKLLRILSLLGIKSDIIGEPINYLGSETIPVCLPYDGLIDYYKKNKHIISENPNLFNQNLVKNHSFV